MTRPKSFAMSGALMAFGVCALVLSSCASSGSGLGLTEGKPRAVVGSHSVQSDDRMTAEAIGKLQVSDGHCFELQGSTGQPVLLVLPAEAHVLSDGWPGVQFLDHQYRLGDQLSAAGGALELSDEDAEVVADCAATGEAFIVQSLSVVKK